MLLLTAFLHTHAAPARAAAPTASVILAAVAQEKGSTLDFSRFQQPTMEAAAAYARRQPAPVPDRYANAASLGSPIVPAIDLDQLLDQRRNSALTFPAGDKLVHVSGLKSENNKSRAGWYFEFWLDGAAEPLHVNGKRAARFAGSHQVRSINGRLFDIWLDIPIFHHAPKDVKLTVSPCLSVSADLDPATCKRGRPSVFTLAQISEAVFATALPMRMGGIEYRLIYSRDFLDNGGEFGGYTADRSLVWLFRDPRDSGGFGGFHRFEREIPSDGRALIATPEKSGPAGRNDGSPPLTLGLRLNDRTLEVYHPIDPAALAR